MQEHPFEATLEWAETRDNEDPLHSFKSQFYFPKHGNNDAIYFCGNSLGLQPKTAQAAMQQELDDWKEFAIEGFTKAKNPWLYYQLQFSAPMAAIAGCREHEVTVMNTLTVNLHLMMLSFYHPTKERYQILMEAGAFPSDQYAVETQVRFYGLDPEKTIIEIHPRDENKIILEEDILDTIDKHKDTLALVLIGGINYYSGQLFDMNVITAAAHKAGALAGFDLAHAIGNAALLLHDWDVDFAVWCSYKYLNGGPGSAGGIYVHEKYARDKTHKRLGGWWGNDEKTRFKMEKGFIPKSDASGWNQSTAQIFNMAPLKASLELFEAAGMKKLHAKSREQTAYLAFLLAQLNNIHFEIITPAEINRRGAQLSLYFKERGKEIYQKMTESGIVVDYREPGVIRVAPVPLYNSFEEVFRLYEILKNF